MRTFFTRVSQQPYAVLMALAGIVNIAALLNLGTPAPLIYDQARYEAKPSSFVCPGDTFSFTPTLTVRDAGRIDVLRSFWDDDTGTWAKLKNGTFAPDIHTVKPLPLDLKGKPRAVPVDIVVPDLQPHHIRLINNSMKPTSDEAQYEVPFTVRADCTTGRN